MGIARTASVDAIKEAYRTLAQKWHPDKHSKDSDEDKIKAETNFRKVQEAYDVLSDPKKKEEYDKNGFIEKNTPTTAVVGKWVVLEPFTKGDICDLYHVVQDGKSDQFIMKVVQNSRDNDLVQAEASALKTLYSFKGGENFLKYIPKCVDAFEASGRRTNVLTPGGNWIPPDKPQETVMTLQRIMKSFRYGLPFRHIVWIGNRGLNALGYAHTAGIVHGAPVPSHLVYGPASHGLYLIDWCYSISKQSSHVPAVVREYASMYPPEIKRKMMPTPSTDIYIFMNSLKNAADLGDIPKRFLPIFDWCLAGSPNARPRDAWELQNRWKALAKEEYGPATYIELVVPSID